MDIDWKRKKGLKSHQAIVRRNNINHEKEGAIERESQIQVVYELKDMERKREEGTIITGNGPTQLGHIMNEDIMVDSLCFV